MEIIRAENVFTQTGTGATTRKVGEKALERISVKDFLAVGDGTTDDSTAFENAIAALPSTGCILDIPRPDVAYKLTRRWTINKSNVLIEGHRSEILFEPTDAVTHDRAILIHTDEANIAAPVNITGSIALGATSLVVASATGLAAGDWLMVQVVDVGAASNIVVFDYVQILSVAGTTVNLVMPIRRAFSSSHGTVFFNKVADANLVKNVTIRNLRVRTTDTVNALPGFFVGVCRNITLDNCVSLPRKGNPYASYRSSNISVLNCFARQGTGQASEFASAAGLRIEGLVSENTDALQPDTSALVLDFGTYGFSVRNCRFGGAANIAVQMTAVAYGQLEGNFFDYVLGPAAYNTLAVTMIGCQYVAVKNNDFNGGEGASSNVINAASSTGYTNNITSLGNVIGPNRVTGFGALSGTRLDTDLYIDTFGGNYWSINGAYESTRPNAGTSFQAARTGDAVPRWLINRDGTMMFGDGSTIDFSFGRVAAGLLETGEQFRAAGYTLDSVGAVALANGANDDIVIPANTSVDISGPTGAFSVTGFAGGVNGRVLHLFNNVAFAMTITNDATSSAANRIVTLTGADVTLRAGRSHASFVYNSGLSRWVLRSTN